MNRLSEAIGTWDETRILGVASTGTLALFGVRFLTPPVSFILPLLGIVAFVAWGARAREGLALSAIAPVLFWLQDLAYHESAVLGWRGAWQVGSEVAVLAITVVTFSRYRRRLQHEAEVASADSLTQLPNRAVFLEKISEEIARAGRYGHVFTLVYMDLDGFKAVNDLQGHDEGDAVLRRVAQVLRSSTRQTDSLGRLGGDEFAALLPHTTAGPAASVLDKLQDNLREAMRQGGWPVTFSIGAATFEAPAESARNALRVADEAMYAVKHSSKDGISHVVWDGVHASERPASA